LFGEIEWGLTGIRARVASASEPSSELAWRAATVAAAAAAGVMVGRGELMFAALPVAGLIALVIVRVPAAGYVAILWSVGTAVDVLALPQFGVSSLIFTSAEVLLWISVACLGFLPRDVRRLLIDLVRRRESVVMTVFLAAVVAGVAVGVEHGAGLHDATFDMRYMLFYAAFWPALVAVSRARRLVLMLVSAGVVLVVALQILQVIVGPSTSFFVIAASDLKQTVMSENGFLRVRPPGLTTVYIASGFALARVLWGPAQGRMVGWGMTAVTLTGVILSLNRNMLLGLILGLAVTALVTPQRPRVIGLAAGLAMVLVSFILVAQSSRSLDSNPVVSRFASVTNYSKLKTQTLNDRYYENRMALQRIRTHPIAGLGWGPDYGAVLLRSDDGFLVSEPRSFMHEQYLWIWMRAGLIGLLALIAMLALGIRNGAVWCRARHGHDDAWLGAGVVVSLVAMAASSNVGIYLTSPDSTVPLVGVLALGAVMARELACGRATSRMLGGPH
jgi:O-Antigen ligase